jgi:hypothetical protein
MISDFFTENFTVRRAVWLEDFGGQYSEETIVGSFKGHKQQASPELIQNLGLSLTKSFSVWCPVDSDVLAGDTLLSGQEQFSVSAVQLNNIGSNRHKELIIELDDEVLVNQGS